MADNNKSKPVGGPMRGPQPRGMKSGVKIREKYFQD